MSPDKRNSLVWYTVGLLREGEFEMSITPYLSEEELIERGLNTLLEALGPMEAMHFLTLPRPRRLESVKRHRQWQESLNREEFFDQVFVDHESAGR